MNLPDLLGPGAPDVEITALAYDDRAVVPGTLFFCVPGFTRDGHDFAPDAVARGAAALVVARPLGLGVPEVRVDDVRAAMAAAAARFHGDPTARCPWWASPGRAARRRPRGSCARCSRRPGGRAGCSAPSPPWSPGRAAPLARTTPEAIELQATFRAMLDGGDRACAMEVSSHALDLHRVDGVRFAVAAFTNLSQDHLDFHPDMEAYFAAKRRLFRDFEVGTAVVCVDDAWGRRLAAERPDAVTVGPRRPGGLARDVRAPGPGRHGLPRRLAGGRGGRRRCRCAAASTPPTRWWRWPPGMRSASPLDGMAAALAAAPPVPGRVQPVEEGQPFAVLVDYSHKPAALENVLATARDMAAGRVIVVFGAGGDRDRGKRPLMGEIAARLADVTVVTSDNPRSEAPEAIIDEIMAGVPAAAEGVERIADRRAAIDRAVALARPGDVVVIAGKGHERGQEFAGGRKEPFDDVAVAARGAAAGRSREGLERRAGGGGRGRRARARRGAPAAARCGRWSTRARSSRATCSSALPGERADGGAFAARGAGGGRLGRAGGARVGGGRRPARAR